MKTNLDQVCTALYNASGEQRFSITSTLTYLHPGDLAHPEIFVMKIGLPTDPKSDVFQRIGTVVDITTLDLSRATALAKNQTLYLSSTFTVDYADVATATTAKQLIQSRVDRLIADYTAYVTSFQVPVDTTFPLVDPDVLAEISSAYSSAVANKTVKDAAVIKATADATLAQANLDASTAALASAQSAYDICNGTQTQLIAVQAAETAFYNAATQFRIDAQTFATAHNTDTSLNISLATMTTALSTVNTAGQGALSALVTNIAAHCTDIGPAVSGVLYLAKADKVAKDAAAASAATALAFATAEAAAAQTAVDVALTAALAACPTFDPSKA